MKKLLSILAAVGLTATASTSVVSCTSNISGDKISFQSADGKPADPLLTSAGITLSNDNYYVSFTKKIRFNKHTNYDEIKDTNGTIIGYRLIPYKLHLVGTTAANLANDSHPQDMFSWGGDDGKGGTTADGNEGSAVASAYVTTKNTKWYSEGKSSSTAWPTPDHKYTDKNDADGNPIYTPLNVDGIIRNDITVKATFTIVIPKASVAAGQTLKVSLVRVEPLSDDVEPGQYMNINDANIKIKIPA